MAGHRPVSSLCPSALGPQKVGVGASPQKAFGCQWQAKRSACPTRGWVKSVSLGMRVTVPQVLSLRGRQYLGVILPFLLSSVSGAGGGRLFGQTSSTMAGTAAQTDPKPPGIPTPPASGAHRGSQAVTWGFSAPPGGWSSAGAPWTVLIIPDDVSSRQMCAGSFEKAGATLPPF